MVRFLSQLPHRNGHLCGTRRRYHFGIFLPRMKTIDYITFSGPNGRYPNLVNPNTLLESWNCLLNRRRFIGPFERSNSQKQTSGCRSCIIPVRILVRITVELHNFSSTWHDDEHRKAQVDKLKDAVEEASKYLPVFTNQRIQAPCHRYRGDY